MPVITRLGGGGVGKELEIIGQQEQLNWLGENISKGQLVTVKETKGYETTAQVTNLSTGPIPWDATIQGIHTSADGKYVAVTSGKTPYIFILKREGETFTKLADPDVLPTGAPVGFPAFSPDGNFLVVPHATTPFVTIYSRSGDTFTKLANPATLPPGISNGAAFSPDGNYIALTHSTGDKLSVYKREGTTFTKLSTNITPAPSGSGDDVVFSPDSTTVAYTISSSPYLQLVKVSSIITSGYQNIDVAIPSNARNLAYSPDGQHLAVVHSGSPYLHIYKVSGVTGTTLTKLPNPVDLPNNPTFSVSYTPDGKYLHVGWSTSPYTIIYKRDGDTYTKVSSVAAAASVSTFGRDGNFFYAGFYVYKPTAVEQTVFGYGGFSDFSDAAFKAVGYAKEAGLKGEQKTIVTLPIV